MIGAELPDEEILGKAYDARLMVRILRYLRPYWKLLAVAFVFLLLQTGTQLLGPYITKIAIDRYVSARDIDGLDLMALAYLGVVVCGFIVLFIQTYTTEYIGQRACTIYEWRFLAIFKSRTWLISTATPSAG